MARDRRIKVTTHTMGPSAKENEPPTKTKRAILVADMFHKRDGSRSALQSHGGNMLRATRNGVAKTKSSLLRSHQPRTNSESMKMRKAFAVTANQYRDEVQKEATRYKTELLEPAYHELIAHVDALDAEQQSKQWPDVMAGEDTYAATAVPFEEQIIESDVTLRDSRVVKRQAKLGQLMHAFEDLLNVKRVHFEQLFKELREVDEEIATVRKDILAVEQTKVRDIKRTWANALDRQAEEIQHARDLGMGDIAKALKEEKKAAEAEKRRLNEALNSL